MCPRCSRLLHSTRGLSLQYTIKLLVLQREVNHEMTIFPSSFTICHGKKILPAEALPTQFIKLSLKAGKGVHFRHIPKPVHKFPNNHEATSLPSKLF